MLTRIKEFVAILFVITFVGLGGLAIVGIWDLVGKDLLSKTYQTIGFLSAAAIVVFSAMRFLDSSMSILRSSELFKRIRRTSLGILILSTILLACVGILAIWDVVDPTGAYQALSTLGVLAFIGMIIVGITLEVEGNEMWRKRIGIVQVGGVLLVLAFFWFLLRFFWWY